MSAYVVDETTISRIISHLQDERHLTNQMARAMYPVDTNERRRILGQAMLDLNVLAVNSRYEDSNETADEYCFEYQLVTEIQAHKSLSCWLYQCSEGGAPETVLFCLMRRICGEIADSIVFALKEHEAAHWG